MTDLSRIQYRLAGNWAKRVTPSSYTPAFYGDPGPGKIYFGASRGEIAERFASKNFSYHEDELTPYNNNIPPRFQVERKYSNADTTFPNWNSGEQVEIQAIVNAGRIPAISSKWAGMADWTDITNGLLDTEITAMVNRCKAFTYNDGTGSKLVPVFWTPWHEMIPDITAAEYKAVVQYVVPKIKAAYGASTRNLLVAWAPGSSKMNLASTRSDYGPNYYPGDTHIDIIGVDGYNYYTDIPDNGGEPPPNDPYWYRDMRAIFQTTADFASGGATIPGVNVHPARPTGGKKPWMVFETGHHFITTADSITTGKLQTWFNWTQAKATAETAGTYASSYNFNGFNNLNQYSTNVDTLMREWYTGPGGVKWLVDTNCKLMCYWPSGGTTLDTSVPEYNIGTQHWTYKYSEKYKTTVPAYDLQHITPAQSARADEMVNAMNTYGAVWTSANGLV